MKLHSISLLCIIFSLFGVNESTSAEFYNVTITQQPSPVTICAPANAQFSVVADGVGTVTYLWQENRFEGMAGQWMNLDDSGIFSGSTTSSLTANSPTGDMSGYYYRCVITDDDGVTNSDPAILTINTEQTITVQPTDVFICSENLNAHFGVQHSGNSGESIQWQVDDGSGGGFADVIDDQNIVGAQTVNLTLSGTPLSSDGHQFRVVLGLCSEIISDTVTLDILDPGQRSGILNLTEEQNTCVGGDAVFSSQPFGQGLTFQWKKGSGELFKEDFDNEPMPNPDTIYSGTIVFDAAWNVNNILVTPSGIEPFSSPLAPGLAVPGSYMETPVLNGGVHQVQFFAATEGLNVNLELSFSTDGGTTFQNIYTTTSIDAEFGFNIGTIGTVGVPTIIRLTALAADEPIYIDNFETNLKFDDLTDDTYYQGSQNDTLIISGANNNLPGLYPNGKAYYKLSYDDTFNCGGTLAEPSELRIHNSPPVITKQPEDINGCDFSLIRETGEANGVSFFIELDTPVFDIKWQLDTGSGFIDVPDTLGDKFGDPHFSSFSISNADVSFDGVKFRAVVGRCDPLIISDEVTLNMGLYPVYEQESSGSVCAGDEAFLELIIPTEGHIYQWQIKEGDTYVDIADGSTYSGTTSKLLKIQTSYSLDGAQYVCVITSTSGSCEISPGFEPLVVYPNPEFVGTPSDVSACIDGNSYGISVMVENFVDQVYIYRWQVDSLVDGVFKDISENDWPSYSSYWGNTAPDGIIDLLIIPSTAMEGFRFRAVITSCEEEYISEAATLTATRPPTITDISPAEQFICEGEFPQFSVEASGDQLTYQWFMEPLGFDLNPVSSGLADGTLTNTLSINTEIFDIEDLTFFCIVKGACGLKDTSGGFRVIFDNPAVENDSLIVVDEEPAENGSTCLGDPITIRFDISGADLTYQWQADLDGNGFVDISDENGFSGTLSKELTVSSLDVGNEGSYRCVVTSTCHEFSSAVIDISAIDLVKPEISMNSNRPPALLSVSNLEGDTFEWFFEGNLVETTSTSTFEANEAGSYSVIASLKGCISPESDPVVVDEPLGLNQTPAVTLYPNPVTRKIKFDVSTKSKYTYVISDLAGKQHMSGNLSTVIDVRNLKSGIYVISIYNASEKSSLKFIKSE